MPQLYQRFSVTQALTSFSLCPPKYFKGPKLIHTPAASARVSAGKGGLPTELWGKWHWKIGAEAQHVQQTTALLCRAAAAAPAASRTALGEEGVDDLDGVKHVCADDVDEKARDLRKAAEERVRDSCWRR